MQINKPAKYGYVVSTIAVASALIIALGVFHFSQTPTHDNSATHTTQYAAVSPGDMKVAGNQEIPPTSTNPANSQVPDFHSAPPAIPEGFGQDLASGETTTPDTDHTQAIGALMNLDAISLRQLIASSDNPVEVQAAVWALANHLNLSDADVDALLTRLSATDVQDISLRKTILWAMSLRPDRIPVETFSDYATNDPIAEVRRTAVRSLSLVKDSDTSTVLRDVVHNDSDAQNRNESLFLLSIRSQDTFDLKESQDAFNKEQDSNVKRGWLGYIGNQHSEQSTPFLEQVLHSNQEESSVRIMAADMLAQTNPQKAAQMSHDTSLPEDIRQHVSNTYVNPQSVDTADLPNS